MLFNSIEFVVFLPVVFVLYWLANKNLRLQNLLLLVASYFFYACWDYRFLFLLIFSTLLDFFTGLKMVEAESHGRKKFWFWLSICVNLGFLGVFKYFNFFAESFADALSLLGFHPSYWTLRVILPVGISFYTFHGLSYVIDLYNGKIQPERNFIDYAVFVCFFPLLVAGPIERATHLLPQIKVSRVFRYDRPADGMRQILWGLFKKVVIADNCATYANSIFDHHNDHSGSTLLLGVVFFAFQIYCDFSGYSDIALGTARLFGIELLRNFAFPYFSRDIAEFWRRWHISLSTWFRDYLYIPMGGNQGTKGRVIWNTIVVFTVSGFWHGANWTFITWGLLNAFYFIPLLITKSNRTNIDIVAKGKLLPSFKEFIQISATFFMTLLAWVFFRSENMTSAFQYLKGIFNRSLLTMPKATPLSTLVLLFAFILIEWIQRDRKHALEFDHENAPNRAVRWTIYYTMVLIISLFGGAQQEFIYFQF